MSLDLYIFKPQAITQDRRLSPLEGDYLCLIAQLSKKQNCTASNQFFADYFGVSRPTAVGILSSLKNKKIIATFEEKLGIKSVLMGFGLEADAIHSPNENYPLEQFYNGMNTIPFFYKYFAE